MGLSQAEMFQDKPDSVVAQERLSAHYPSGASDPAAVVTRADGGRLAQVRAAAEQVPGVASVGGPGDSVRTGGHELATFPVVLKDAPDSDAAKETIDALRDAVHAVDGALVGGTTAQAVDTERAADRDLTTVIPIVLLVVLAVLVWLLRSLVAPLLLLATVVVSYFAALGTSHLLFEHVLDFAAMELVDPADGLRLPRRARHRLQHLPDDPGTGGDRAPRPHPRRPRWPHRHRRRDHLGGRRARGDLRGPAAGHHGAARRAGRRRRAARHLPRPHRPGPRPGPGHRPEGLVARRPEPRRLARLRRRPACARWHRKAREPAPTPPHPHPRARRLPAFPRFHLQLPARGGEPPLGHRAGACPHTPAEPAPATQPPVPPPGPPSRRRRPDARMPTNTAGGAKPSARLRTAPDSA